MKKEKEFRVSTLEERQEFYLRKFNLRKVKKWFKIRGKVPQLCALDAGSDTGIILDKKDRGNMLYFEFKDLKEMAKKYAPEDVYYDRNEYRNPRKVLDSMNFKDAIGQELAFDIDADNIVCKCKNKAVVCEKCLKEAFSWTLKMKKILVEEFGFKKLKIVYSGRGFHIHVFDKKAFKLGTKERDRITRRFRNFPIDSWVTRGGIRLIRMPYSLNALVNKKVIPINSDKFRI